MALPGHNGRRRQWFRHALESRAASLFGLFLVVMMGIVGFAQVIPNLVLTIGILTIIVYEFQKRLDQGVPLLQLTSLIAVLQWLVGPALNYSTAFSYGRYAMYVPEAEYFRFALPATAFYVALMLATGVSVRQANLLEVVDRSNFFTIGIVLNIVGIAAALIAPRVGGSLAFLMHLVSQLRHIGAIYFLFSRSPLRLLFAGASCVQLVSGSMQAGMFHDLILWLAILFCFWFAQRSWSLPTKAAVLLTCCACLFAVQVVKQDYRKQLRSGLDPSLFMLALEYLSPEGRAWKDESLSLVVTRLNQGWIISAVMKHVPTHEPYARGDTIEDAVTSALLPRFIAPDKKIAGGRENFRRFTGLRIGDSTSMAISPLGESYANFGPAGGIVCIVIFGLLFTLCYYGTLRYALKHPTFLFWIPLIFYQAIKAETEFVVVLNQITKGAVVAFGGHYLISQTFKTRIRKPVPGRQLHSDTGAGRNTADQPVSTL